MSDTNTNNSGMGFGLLTIVFVVLKLTHTIDWSWWWVTAPTWGVAALVLILCGLLMAVAGVANVVDAKRERSRVWGRKL